MKITLIGATGFIGRQLLNEAAHRQHEVTALVRDAGKMPAKKGVVTKALDINESEALIAALKGQDAVIVSTSYNQIDTQALVESVKRAGVSRLLVVGGAGSLEVAPGLQLVDTPDFPAEWKAGAQAARDFLRLLRTEKNLDWVYLSPSAHIKHGQRTGKFRIGHEQLLIDEQGESRISLEDYAVALFNELEQPSHHRERFTVGY